LYENFDVNDLMEFIGAIAGAIKVVDDLLESSSSDESLMSDEDDDTETFDEVALLLYREEHGKQSDYMTVIKQYSDLDHWRHFRVTRSTAQDLIDFVEPFMDKVIMMGDDDIGHKPYRPKNIGHRQYRPQLMTISATNHIGHTIYTCCPDTFT